MSYSTFDDRPEPLVECLAHVVERVLASTPGWADDFLEVHYPPRNAEEYCAYEDMLDKVVKEITKRLKGVN